MNENALVQEIAEAEHIASQLRLLSGTFPRDRAGKCIAVTDDDTLHLLQLRHIAWKTELRLYELLIAGTAE